MGWTNKGTDRMNAHQTNRYADRLLVLYHRNHDPLCRQVINQEWSAAWADLLRQYSERLQERISKTTKG